MEDIKRCDKPRRILVASDIHGYGELLRMLLNASNFNPNRDLLVLLGDYIDRGPRSPQTVAFIRELKEEGAVVLKGNHEEMPIYHGGSIPKFMLAMQDNDTTLGQYIALGKRFENVLQSDMTFLSNLPIKLETQDYLFVHAGINPNKPMVDQTQEEILDIRYLDDYEGVGWWEKPHSLEKTVVFGHTGTSWMGKNLGEVYFGHKVIGIDTECWRGGKLSLLELPSRKVYQA
jgi:Predicted phosphohydrolases